jgi:hypothetical protein
MRAAGEAAGLAGVLLMLASSPAWGAHDGKSPGGTFAIETVELEFEDGTDRKVVTKGERIQAVAEVTFTGAGLLNGIWRIAEPAPEPDQVRFTDLLIINKNLSSTGKDIFRSPSLPTGTAGSYSLRLVIQRPSYKEKHKEIKYFVGQPPGEESPGAGGGIPRSIKTTSPAADRPADKETKFSWAAVPGSVAYQVEIYHKTGKEKAVIKEAGKFNVCLVRLPSELNRPPTMGVMVPAFKTEAKLNQFAGRVLKSGTTYLWRVVALAKDGKVLCESPFKEFLFSE